jgi:hypothetical protein
VTDHTIPHYDELERRVADVLHDHAEIAMSRTDTEGRLQPFLADVDAAARRRRTTWAISAVAAAAAVVVALVLTGVPGLPSDDAENLVPAQDRTAVRIAADFVDAFADYDPVRASRDLGTGADMKIWEDTDGTSEWQRGLVWAEAAGFKVLPGDCAPEPPNGSRTMVRCPFDVHVFGSDRVGKGPYPDNAFDVVVDKGEIVTTEMVIPFETNGFAKGMWDPFSRWLEREHPADFAVMIREVGGVQWPSFTDDSISRWRLRMVDWLALHHALDTGPSSGTEG